VTSPSSRILTLLSLLQARQESSATFLAERLGVSPRTVRRDVERLRELGYTVTTLRGPAGGYRLSAGAELPPLLFDDDQAVAVALALAVAPASGTAIGEAAARALGTVRQVMPSRLRHRMDSIEVLSTPSTVVVDPEALRFDYAPVWGEAEVGPPLSVEPHAVVTSNGRWYLLAWAPAADDWRTYRVDRMHPRAATRRSFSRRPVPGDDPVAFVAARFRGSTDASWPCVGTATIDLPARDVAPYVDADALVEQGDDGRTRLTTGSWSWRALAARFAGFDADLTLEGPPALVEAGQELARRLLDSRGPSPRP
jgi:predicted DNA-binding transcriptional regulator YafY